MRITDVLAAAARNARRNVLRTMLTALAIVIGALTLTLTTGVGSALTTYLDEELAGLGSTATMELTKPRGEGDGPAAYQPQSPTVRGSFGSTNLALSRADLDAARGVDGVREVRELLPIQTRWVAWGAAHTAAGGGPAVGERYDSGLTALEGDRALQYEAGDDPDPTADEVALPAAYLESLGGTAEDAVGRIVTFGFVDAAGGERTIDATVSGIIRRTIVPAGNPVASAALASAIHEEQTRGLTAGQLPPVASATIVLEDGLDEAAIEQVGTDLEALGLAGATVNDRLGTFHTVITAISLALSAFAAITLLAAAFGIVNTLLMAVQERTREIGILKAHGLRGHTVFTMFCSEAAVIGITGALVGIGLGTAGGWLIDRAAAERLADLPGLRAFVADPGVLAAIVGGIALLAVVAGTVPALRAARREPIAALRHE